MLLSLFALMQLLTYMLCMKKYFITFKTNVALFDLILAPSYNILSSPHSVGSMAKLISLNDDDEEPLRKVCTKLDGVHISLQFLSCCSILNSFNMLLSNNKCWPFDFCFYKYEKFDVPSHLHNYFITCKGGHKGCGSNLNNITLL